jgi:hypothetical protein
MSPTWDELPIDPIVEYGTHFVCNLNASDPSGIESWWINNTVQFIISPTGSIYMTIELEPGDYPLTVYVSDRYGQTTQAELIIQVRDTTSPEWMIVISNQYLDYGADLSYQLVASDLSGISNWTINDTTNFDISDYGLVTNIIPLSPGQYDLLVSVYDPYGNELVATFSVFVSSQTTTAITTSTTPSTTITSITTEPTITETSTTSIATSSTNTSSTPITAPPTYIMILIVIGLGVGAGVVVVIIIIVIRRKS